MATVMGGVSYGLYAITKRYVAPLISPPTPEKLDQDKGTVDEQFEKAFASLEQLAKDTEALKASEHERAEKLDKVLEELDTFMRDTKTASRRQEDDTERLREDLKTVKSSIPGAMAAHKDFTDGRLKEISTEVKSLKSLVGQRMNSNPSPAPPASAAASGFRAPPITTTPTTSNNYTRPYSNGAVAPSSPAVASVPAATSAATTTPAAADPAPAKQNGETANGDGGVSVSSAGKQDYMSSLGGRSSPFGSGMPAGKASIPAWQLAAAAKSSDAGSSQAQQAGSSS